MENEHYDLENYDVHAVTSRSLTKFTFKWTVSDLSLMEKPLTSPIFKVPFVSDCSLKLNWDANNKVMLELLLRTDSKDETWNIALYDKKGQLLYHFRTYKLTSTTVTSDAAIPLGNLPNDVLVVLCEFTSTRIVSEICRSKQPLPRCQERLSADLKTLYDHPRHTDVVLRVDEEEVRAHRAVLAARSPVFQRMFQSGLGERDVPIADVSLRALKQLLEFVYAGTVELDDSDDASDVYPLYYAADKYEVLDLRGVCSEAMRAKLSVENALAMVVWADRHRDEALRASVMDFVRWNFKRVVESDDWPDFVKNQGHMAALLVKFCLN